MSRIIKLLDRRNFHFIDLSSRFQPKSPIILEWAKKNNIEVVDLKMSDEFNLTTESECACSSWELLHQGHNKGCSNNKGTNKT